VIVVVDLVAGLVIWFDALSFLGPFADSSLVTNRTWAAVHTVATVILIPLLVSLVVVNWGALRMGLSRRGQAADRDGAWPADEQTAVTAPIAYEQGAGGVTEAAPAPETAVEPAAETTPEAPVETANETAAPQDGAVEPKAKKPTEGD
jgi:hypothetical protein